MDKKLPLASFALMKELNVHPEATQRKTTSYLLFETLVDEFISANKGKTPVVVDIGAGRGDNVKNLEVKGIKVIAVEPSPDPKEWGLRTPDCSFSSEVEPNIADLIFNSYVLNVVPEDVGIEIIRDIGNILKPGGQALIITRGTDVANATAVNHPEYGLLEWSSLEKITKSEGKLTYQKGHTFKTLFTLINNILPEFNIEKHNKSSVSSVKILITKPN